jgi:DNA helicase-2/ATP-dependent DNA helicase PcrA
MTRAKQGLHLLLPQRFYVHQQTTYVNRHVYACDQQLLISGARCA